MAARSPLGILAAFVLVVTACSSRAALAQGAASDSAAADSSDSPSVEILLDDYNIQDSVVPQGFSREFILHRIVHVLTAAGAQDQSTGSIPYLEGMDIADLRITCTSPTGRKTTLRPEKMFDRLTVRLGRFEMREKTFALPGLVAGSRIETDLHLRLLDAKSLEPVLLPMQRDVPVRRFAVSVRPWVEVPFVMRTNTHLASVGSVQTDPGGRIRVSATDLPAYRHEPRGPSAIDSRAMVLGSYIEPAASQGIPYLKNLAQSELRELGQMKDQANDSLYAIVRRVTYGIDGDKARARALFDFCHAELRNNDAGPDSGKAQIPDGLFGPGLLRTLFVQRVGSSAWIDLAYMALCRTARLDTHAGLLVSPVFEAFDPGLGAAESFSSMIVGVGAEDGYIWSQPGDYWTPFGMIPPQLQGAPGIFSDFSYATSGHTLDATPEQSELQRVATLTLGSDGTLTGDVVERRTGYEAMSYREALRGLDAAGLASAIERDARDVYPAIELDHALVFGLEDVAQPCETRYHLTLPDHAQSVGDQLVVPLSYFPRLADLSFNDSRRTQPIELPWGRCETDTVRITMPAAFHIDPSPPDAIAIAPIGEGRTHLQLLDDHRTVEYSWRARVGGAGERRVTPEGYAALRDVLMRVHTVASLRVPARGAVSGRPGKN